ncbi:MAG: type II secretion system protein [bacterium]
MKHTYRKAFTLIELLIVVAIIGILAAIAVPNFLNAQVRAGVTRVKADFRTIMTALETYRLDNNDYPPDLSGPNNEDWAYKFLTTPVAYLNSTEVCRDYFTAKTGRQDEAGFTRNFYDYGQVDYIRKSGLGFVIISFAPDRGLDMPWTTDSMDILSKRIASRSYFLYESSNGLTSSGDIIGTGHGLHNN